MTCTRRGRLSSLISLREHVACGLTEQDIADLAAVVAEIESAIGASDGLAPDPAQWSRLTHRFHVLIMQRSGNKTLALQGAMLHDIVATHTELWVSRNPRPGRVARALPAGGRGLPEAAGADRGGRRGRRRAPVAPSHGRGRGLPAQGRPAGQAGSGTVHLSPTPSRRRPHPSPPRRQFRMAELLPHFFRLMGCAFIVKPMTSGAVAAGRRFVVQRSAMELRVR